MVRILMLLIAAALCLSGCQRLHEAIDPVGARGEKIQIDNGEIYYRGGVTRAEAEAVGKVLQDIGFFGDESWSVQLVKEDNKYQVRFVIKPEFQNDEDVKLEFRGYGGIIAREVFRDAPVEVHICDDQLKTLSSGAAMEPMNGYELKRGNLTLWYKGSVTKEQAGQTADLLQQGRPKDSPDYTVQIVGSNGTYQFRFIPEMHPLNPIAAQIWKSRVRKISAEVFDNAPFEIHSCDAWMNTVSVIKP